MAIYIANADMVDKVGIYDEVWLIVLNPVRIKSGMIHVPELAPSRELYSKYMRLKGAKRWNTDTFQKIYVPQFLNEITKEGYDKLTELYRRDKAGEKICLVCYCVQESLCHRSIIAGMLQGVGCNVKTSIGSDYSYYLDEWKKLHDK